MPRNRSEKGHAVLKHKVWLPTDSSTSSSKWIDCGGSLAFLVQHPTGWEYRFSVWLQCHKAYAEEFSIRAYNELHEAHTLWALLDTSPAFWDIPRKEPHRRATISHSNHHDWITTRDGPWPIVGPGLWDGEHFPNGIKGFDEC